MDLHYEYENSPTDYEALARITQQRAFQAGSRTVWNTTLWYSLILAVAAYALLAIDQMFIACLLVTIIGLYFYSALRFKGRFWDAVSRNIVCPKGPIVLKISDAGMTELCEQIESFAPWSAVTRTISTPERTFIELSSRLWAIIPHQSLSPSSDPIQSLLILLQEKERKT